MAATATTPEPAPAGPTARQLDVLRAIVRHIRDTGQSPSIRELCAATGIASPNGLMCHLTALHKKGWVVYEVVKQINAAGLTARSRRLSVPQLTAALKEAAAGFLNQLKGA